MWMVCTRGISGNLSPYLCEDGEKSCPYSAHVPGTGVFAHAPHTFVANHIRACYPIPGVAMFLFRVYGKPSSG